MGIQINGNTDTISALDGSWTSDSATHFTGKVSIGGTLTYEDVTNIDAVGIVTVRSGGYLDVRTGSSINTNATGASSSGTLHKNTTSGEFAVVSGGTGGNNHLTFYTSASAAPDEKVRITSTGLVGIGTDNPDVKLHMVGDRLQVDNTGNPFMGRRFNAGADGAVLFLEHSRSGTIGTKVKLNDNDEIGSVQFRAYASDNSTIKHAASIKAEVNGTTSANGVPTDLIFNTGTTSGNADEKLRITSGGQVNIGGNYSETSHPFNISHSTKPSLALHTGTTLRADLSATSGITSIRSYANSPFTINIGGSGETEAFRINSSGNVSIGNNPTVASDTRLHVEKAGETNVIFEGDTTTLGARLTLKNNNTATGALNQIDFADAGGQSTSSIKGFNTDQTNNYGDLAFFTRDAQGSPPAERLRIDSTGRLLANGAVAGNAFVGGDDLIIGNASSGTRSGMTLVSHGAQDGGVYFSRGTSSNSDYVKGQLVYNHPNDYFAIYTGGTGIRLKIDGLGGHNIYNDNSYSIANLAECDSDKVALNIRKTRNGQTKGIALGSIGNPSETGIQAYDSSDDSANELALNPYGGALLVGLTTPTYSSGDIQHEIKKNNSRTYTAPLMAAHSHLLLNNSDTTAGVFCGIGMRAGTGDGAIGFHYRGATNQSDFVIATDSGANGVEGFRIKSQTRTCSIGENVDPLNALHILDKTTSSWDGALTANRAALRVETHYTQQGARAVGDYGGGIVFNHLAGHSSAHNNDAHAWLGLRVHDTPGYERSCLVFATNDITGSEAGHDAGLKERMQINPHGQVAINYSGTMTSSSHAQLWVETPGNNLATEWDPGDNQGTKPHLTLAGQNNHVRLDIGTMDVAPFAGYIQARYDNSPDLGATDSSDGLEPLMIQPRGGQTYFNFGHSTTMPANFDPTSEEGGIKIRAGTADSASVSEANTAIKIWPAKAREYNSGRMGDADQGSKYGGIAWLVMDGQSNSGWAAYDGNLCWMGMSIHSTPGQELGNWQLRMNDSGNQNSVANKIALQASPQGWVTKPNHIVFMAHHNAGTRITATGYQTFGDQIEDNGGDHYSNSNGKFTAPIGGYYYLYLKVNAVNRIDMQIRINGSTDHTHREIGQFNTSNDAGGWWSHNIVRIFRMEKDEYAQVYISSLNQQTDPGEWCTFGGFLIG